MKFAKWKFLFSKRYEMRQMENFHYKDMKCAKWKFPLGESVFAKLPNDFKFAKWKNPFGESVFAKPPNCLILKFKT